MTIHDWQLFICVQEVIDFNLLYFESKRERGWEEKNFEGGQNHEMKWHINKFIEKERERKLEKLTFN